MLTLPYVDLVKVTEVEVSLLTGRDVAASSFSDLGAASKALLEKGPGLCVVTLGPEGSYFRTAAGGERVPPFRVQTVDATGCGDAFVAGLLSRLVQVTERGPDRFSRLGVAGLSDILSYANAVGALTSLTRGVIPALPTTAQVDRFLSERT